MGSAFVGVLGLLIDTGTWAAADVAIRAAAEALGRSDEGFLDATDQWSGRYLVIFGNGASCHVMTDATGMRAAFYSLDGPFVLASHARLVANAIAAAPSPIVGAHRETVLGSRRSTIAGVLRAAIAPRSPSLVSCYPGRTTPWTGVVHLTANLVLDTATRRLRRIFPRRPSDPMSSDDAAALVAPRLDGQMTALAGWARPLAMSITGGVDSRVSLAASRDVREAVHYFTYQRPAVSRDAADVAAASSMASKFRLRHSVLHIDPAADGAPLTAVLREATFLSHGRAIVGAYRSTFSADTIHIRSNIGEVGRCHYHRTSAGSSVTTSPADVSARELAAMWAHRSVTGPVVAAFDDWIAASRFRHIRGFDARDLFYWEHRMSCWHSNVVLESDFAFDTHVLFNSRWILERLLAAPFVDRCRGTSFAALVAILWPELRARTTDVRAQSDYRAGSARS